MLYEVITIFAKQAQEVDIIITTALIPGKPAPKLITAEMVRSMRPGSVIVDMAAEQGGNCELTEPGQVVVKHGVTIVITSYSIHYTKLYEFGVVIVRIHRELHRSLIDTLQARRENEDLRAQAQASEAQMRDAIESFPEGIAIFDDAGALVSCNDTYAQRYGGGRPREALVGASYVITSYSIHYIV